MFDLREEDGDIDNSKISLHPTCILLNIFVIVHSLVS